MRSVNACERVAAGESLEGLDNLIDRDVHRLPAVFADEVLVVGLGAQVDDGRAVAEVDVMQDAEPFENVDRPIDRRLVDADARNLLGALTDLRGIEMHIAARSECIAHRPARRCDAETFRAKVTNQRFGFHQGARKAGTPVIALPRISIWISFVPSYV